jgi:hypothetical protein
MRVMRKMAKYGMTIWDESMKRGEGIREENG